MAEQKYYYYVGVMSEDGRVQLVTKVNYSNNTWECDYDERPLEMSQASARDLAFGINCNFRFAFVLENRYPLELSYNKFYHVK